jgi:hypothetical protein
MFELSNDSMTDVLYHGMEDVFGGICAVEVD